MSKLYLQEQIVGNPGQILTINNSNQLSLTEYKPALNSVIKVNGPVNATIYASYASTTPDIPASSVKGILKYDHEYSAKAINNISSVSINLDTWMTTTYVNNYQNVFTYTSGNWKNSNNDNVNLTNLGISYELSSGSNPTNGTTITITVDYDKARYEIYPPNAGTWTLVCKTNTGYSETTQVVEANNTYEIDMSIFQAFIGVTYTNGATCKVINEEHGITITAPNTDGYNIFTVPYSGLWKIEVTLTAQSASTGEDFVKERHEYVNITTLNQQLSRTVNVISSVLDECTWDEIKYVADNHLGPYYWSIGDCKAITLNGITLGTYYTQPCVNDLYYVFIIGFDHNSSVEGSGITFQFGKFDKTSEYNICIDEKNRLTQSTRAAITSDDNYYFNYFRMRRSTESYGWSGTTMRSNILGSQSKTPYDSTTNPTGYPSGSLMAGLPLDLRSVLKGVTKWTDNTGGSTLSVSNVTATTEYLFLPSAYEIFGTVGTGSYHANNSEANKQEQYAYYINKTPIACYLTTQNTTQLKYAPTTIYLRSPVNYVGSDVGQYFAAITYQGALAYVQGFAYSNASQPGITPCFVVGSEDPAS